MTKVSLIGYTVAHDPTLLRGGLLPMVAFGCGGCLKDTLARLRKGLDTNDQPYPAMICPECGRVNAIRRPTGEMLAWHSRNQVLEQLRTLKETR